MKRFLILLCLAALCSVPATAQKLLVGDRAPELRVKEYLYGAPRIQKPVFIEFFQSSSAPCLARLAAVGEMATKYAAELHVTLLSNESAEKVNAAIGAGNHPYFVALDDGGKTFAAYGVQYVPFGVLVDSKGRIAWFGNPASLSDAQLGKLLK